MMLTRLARLTRLSRHMTVFAAALVAGALLAAACGGDSQSQPSAAQSQQPQAYQAGDPQSAQSAQSAQLAQAEEQPRVQVVRGRATLGSPDAPILITEYSDFL